MNLHIISNVFQTLFGRPPMMEARAPGRVNLIGEHIDYLGGTVLPMAINRSVHAWIAPNGGAAHRFSSVQFIDAEDEGRTDKIIEIPADAMKFSREIPWANYPMGVVDEFLKRGAVIPGFDLLIDGDVPAGSGLSSSAAVEVAVAVLLNHVGNVGLRNEQLALLAQSAERNFVGVPCGIMDQAASACCKADHALMLDCRPAPNDELRYTHRALPADAAFVIAHCGVKRNLRTSEYAKRQEECDEALELIRKETGEPHPFLSRVPIEAIQKLESRHPEKALALKRARFAVEENQRVADFCEALENDDLDEAGRLINESHYGLRDLYEVSIPELDELTGIARSCEGVYGSRLTGAGFGGCTITLVRSGQEDRVIATLEEKYYEPHKFKPLIFATRATDGASLV